jgi:hypothetical protein
MILEDLKKQLAEEENDHQQTRRNLLEYAAIAELIKEKWDASVVKLERRLETATKDAELREPLVQVGSAIRKRFLEQAKETSEKSRAQLIIEAGNIAAHHANILADQAVLSLVCHSSLLHAILETLRWRSPMVSKRRFWNSIHSKIGLSYSASRL